MRAVEAHQKVNAGRLKRCAYLYIRQSTLRQVIENTETKRQYDLGQHAVALDWPVEQIAVIDNDLGQSGASAVDREGFQQTGRNSTDRHRLLEIWALTYTLILDEDGVYDPALCNDRLLLGLKGAYREQNSTSSKPACKSGF